MKGLSQKIKRFDAPQLLFFGAAAAALISRLFRLGWHPLWVDEIYSYNVSQMSIRRILENSITDPHPPASYLLLKAGTLFAPTPSETWIRFFSALAGTAVILVLFRLAQKHFDRKAAIAGLVFLLVSPTILFYSQEARPHIFSLLAASLTTYFVFMLPRNGSKDMLYSWALVSAIGIYFTYSYLIILAGQALFLFWLYRFQKEWIMALIGILILLSPLILLLVPMLGPRLSGSPGQVLTLNYTLRTLLATDPSRYPIQPINWLPLSFFALTSLLALIRAALQKEKFLLYLVLQFTLPLIIFFPIGNALLGFNLPNYQSRQFLILLPSVFIACLAGFDWGLKQIRPKAGWILTGLAVIMLGVSALAGLNQYWNKISKSPEGELIRDIRTQLKPGDALISLNLSLTYTIDFYIPERENVYAFPQDVEGRLFFDRSRFFLTALISPEPLYAIETVKSHESGWLVRVADSDPELVDLLLDGCESEIVSRQPPFEAIHIFNCR